MKDKFKDFIHKIVSENKVLLKIKEKIIPLYDRIRHCIKNHKLFSALCGVLAVMIIVFIFALIFGWGVDKSKPGIYFRPELSECDNDEINLLIESYYTANVKGDVETIKTFVTNPEDITSLREKDSVIEAIDNVSNKCIQGISEDSYVVYACWNVKFNNIEQLAPGMEVFYIIYKDNAFYIKNDLSEEEMNYINKIYESDAVMTLYSDVEADLQDALKNESLNSLYEYMIDIQ